MSGLRDLLRTLIGIVRSEHIDKVPRGAFVGAAFGAVAPLLSQQGKGRGRERNYHWAVIIG